MQDAPKIGSILLGKYRVEQVLGQGGMGRVVAARHETLGELFAIKMMLPEALKYRDARERFIREARAAARIKGEHVARVHDVGTLDNGAPYMLMEHLTGEDLKQILEKRGALSVHEAALYVHQACEAVAEAHALGIAHRDLKPANMFLTRRSNGSPCVKVLDFGISKEVDANKVGPALTKTGMAVGTPMYMAPEQMANTKTTDLRSDIWALGIILYELVTGKPPFCSEAMTELVSLVLTAEPVPPSNVRPNIPAEFDALVLRCLEKKPDKRLPAVRDLMTALLPFTAPNLSQTVAGLQDPPAASREGVNDTTTMEFPRRAAPSAPVLPTFLLPTIPVPVDAKSAAAAQVSPGGMGQTGGAWGGTSRIFSVTRKQSWTIVAGVVGAVVLVSVAVFVVTRPASSDDTAAAASAAPAESAAPILSAATLLVDNAKPIPTAQEAAAPVTSAKSPQETATPTKTPPEKTATTSQTKPSRPAVSVPSPTTTSKSRIPDY